MLRFLFLTGCCIALLPASPLWAQRTLSLEPFDEVSVTGNVEVTLAESDEEAATLTVKNIPEEKVSIKVKRGVLKINVLESMFYKNEQIEVYVTYRTLRAIRGDAGARIENESVLEGDELLARAGSGSEMDLLVQLSSLEAGASEGGVLRISGETERQEITAATGGRYEAFELDSRRTYAKANTGGEAEVVALEYLEASANTGGTVYYKGNPEEANMKTALSGNVKKM